MIIFLAFSFFSLILFIESHEEFETKVLIALISNLQIFYIILLAELYICISLLLVLVESYHDILQVYAMEGKVNTENTKKKPLNQAKLGFFRNLTLLVTLTKLKLFSLITFFRLSIILNLDGKMIIILSSI